MPNIRWLIGLITVVHRLLYRASGGRLGQRGPGTRFLLLTTTGRRTGRRRTVPLLYVRDGERWAVVASNAGDPRDPAWWLNLQARPRAEIRVGADRRSVRARRATGEEADRLWPALVASYRHYADYRRRTTREIPVVLLEAD